jgi:4-amino-4-deoxy-L-arabinose transferase-like glycosyltransferase
MSFSSPTTEHSLEPVAAPERTYSASAANARKQALIMAVLALVFVAIRCVLLTADAPLRVHGRDARELFAEPPAKSHEARNWALFGDFEVNPADDYQFWRAQSPVWVYPLAGYFRVFGTDYPQLRTFSTLYATLGFLLLLSIAAPLMRTSIWVFMGLALALDPLYFHTSRVGFIEPAVATWVTFAVWALLRAERDLRWLIAAYAACALAFFTKQAGLYALPLAAFATLYLGGRAMRGTAEERGKVWEVITGAIVVVALSGLYIATSDYWRAVTHNFAHVLLGSEAPPPNRYRGVGSLLYRLYDEERYEHFMSALPVTGLIAVVTLLYFCVRLVRSARSKAWPPYHEAVLFFWFACTLLAMQAIAKSQLRFWTIVIPAAALIAGLGIEWARRTLAAHGKRGDRWLLAIPLIALVAWSGYGHFRYIRSARNTVVDAARAIEAHIGKRDATVVGFASPGIVLGTPYKNFYIRGRFNAERSLIAKLGVTHLLLLHGRDPTRIILQREFPGLVEGLRPELDVRVRNQELSLYDAGNELR